MENGEVLLDGLSLKADPIRFKERIGYVCEDTDIYTSVKAIRFVDFVKGFYKAWDEKKFKELIHLFELDLKKIISSYSKGMKVKLHLAIALSHRARLLIMDEPTSGLDPFIRTQVLEVLKAEAEKNGTSVIFSTHITEDIVKAADSVAFLSNGQLVFTEKISTLEKHYFFVEQNRKISEEIKRRSMKETSNGYLVFCPEEDVEFRRVLLESQARQLSFDEIFMCFK